MENQAKQKEVWFTVVVAALGYFVDIFDLQLFNVIGKQSLGAQGLNLSPQQIDYYYDFVLFNFQMGGRQASDTPKIRWDERGRRWRAAQKSPS